MSAIFAFIYRLIGFGGCAFIALYIYDWGIPGAARIPYLASIPILGELTTGRAHTYAADQVKLATADMVTKFERDTLQAQLDEERRRRAISEAASAKAQERADATQLAKAAADARVEELEAEAKRHKLPTWTEEELRWYGQH